MYKVTNLLLIAIITSLFVNVSLLITDDQIVEGVLYAAIIPSPASLEAA